MKFKKGSLYLKACLEKFDIDSSHTNDYDLLTQVWNDNLNDVHALSNFACFLHTLEQRWQEQCFGEFDVSYMNILQDKVFGIQLSSNIAQLIINLKIKRGNNM